MSTVAFGHPEAQLDRQQNVQRVRELVARLPLEYREVIVLREFEELSYREISEILAIPEGTVMSRLSRGRNYLRALAASEAADDAV